MKLIVAALLLCVCFAEDTLVPFLVVKKDVSETHVVVGGSLTVNITISNKGASPAFSANVVDKSPDGTEQTAAFEKLAPGEVQTLSYVVRSDKVGDWNLTAAEVTYKDKEDAVKTRKAFSNLIREEEHVAYGEGSESRHVRGIVHVLSQDDYARLHSRHIKEIIAFILLGLLPVIFPFFVFRAKQNQVEHLLREANKKK